MSTDSSFLAPDARPGAGRREGHIAARLLERLRPAGAAGLSGIRRPGTLERRRRLLRLRRLAIALCAAGLVLGIGLLLLPEPRTTVIVPSADIPQGRRLDRTGLSTRQIPESMVDGFLTDRTSARGCIARIRLALGDLAGPAAMACSLYVPALRRGQTIVSILTSLTPDTMDVGAPGERADRGLGSDSRGPVGLRDRLGRGHTRPGGCLRLPCR